MAKNSKKTTTTDGFNAVPVDNGSSKTTRNDVAAETNPAVDATRVRGPFSPDNDAEDSSVTQLNADNAVELLTDNEIAKRNREVANYGTSREGEDAK